MNYEAKAVLAKGGHFSNDSSEMRHGAALVCETIFVTMIAFVVGEEVMRINRQPAELIALTFIAKAIVQDER